MSYIPSKFFELTNDLFIVADFKGRFVRVNQEWEKTLGWSSEELTSRPFSSFVHPDDKESTEQESWELTQGKTTVSFQNRYRCKDGGYRHLLWKCSPDMDEELIYGVARDITVLKNRESVLLKDNFRLEQILNSFDDFILLKDRDSRLLWANRSFRDFYGFSPDENVEGVIDKSSGDPELTERYIKDDLYVVNNKKRLVIPWEPSLRHDNQVRKLRVTKSPIFDNDGNVIMTVGVSKDITEDLEKEALIKEQQAKMINSARLSSLGEMAAGIAHEVNNPLTIIDAIIFQTTSRLERKQLTLEELPAVFDRINKSVHRIARIVKSFRFFSRNSENDPFTIASLDSIFQETAELCQEKFKMGEVALRIKGDPDLHVLCRPSEIGQVLLNLISNSFDAVSKKPGAWVEISSHTQGDRVFVQVRDSGNGIPQQIQHEMMNPFFTTKEVGQGTGLGLSIALGIVKAHGGELTFDDQSGHSQFTFDLQNGDL